MYSRSQRFFHQLNEQKTHKEIKLVVAFLHATLKLFWCHRSRVTRVRLTILKVTWIIDTHPKFRRYDRSLLSSGSKHPTVKIFVRERLSQVGNRKLIGVGTVQQRQGVCVVEEVRVDPIPAEDGQRCKFLAVLRI